uniref:Cell division protein n=1 Tax=Draparnaldia mutabilis TaxID=1683230 RepID=A0A6H1U7N2_9CHLO|nr:cell division protein [Draparnaldia mutabilis]
MLKTRQMLRNEKLRAFKFSSSHFFIFSSRNSCFFNNNVQKSQKINCFSYNSFGFQEKKQFCYPPLKQSTIDWHCTKPLARNQLGLWFSFLAQPFSTRKHWWILLPSQNLLFRLRWETLELKDFVESTSLNVSHLNWFSEKPFYFYVIVPFLGCLGLIYTSLNSNLTDYPEKISTFSFKQESQLPNLLDMSFKNLQKKDLYQDKNFSDLSLTGLNDVQEQYIGTYGQKSYYNNYLNSSKLFLNLKNSSKTVFDSDSSSILFRTLRVKSKEKNSFIKSLQSQIFESWWTEKNVSQIYSFSNMNSKLSEFKNSSFPNFAIWENYVFQKAKIQWFWYKWCPNDFLRLPNKISRTVWEKLVGPSNYNASRNLLTFFKQKNNNIIQRQNKDFKVSSNPSKEMNDEFAQKLFSGNLYFPQNYLTVIQESNPKSVHPFEKKSFAFSFSPFLSNGFSVPLYSQLSRKVQIKLDKNYSFKLKNSHFLESARQSTRLFSSDKEKKEENFPFDTLILINGLKPRVTTLSHFPTNSMKNFLFQLKKDFKEKTVETKQIDFYGLFGRLNHKNNFNLNSIIGSTESLHNRVTGIKETRLYFHKAYQNSEEKNSNSRYFSTETSNLFCEMSDEKANSGKSQSEALSFASDGQSCLDYFTAAFFFDNVAGKKSCALGQAFGEKSLLEGSFQRYKVFLKNKNLLNLNTLVPLDRVSEKYNKMALSSKVTLLSFISASKKTKVKKLNFPILLSGYFARNVRNSQLNPGQLNKSFQTAFSSNEKNNSKKLDSKDLSFSFNHVGKKDLFLDGAKEPRMMPLLRRQNLVCQPSFLINNFLHPDRKRLSSQSNKLKWKSVGNWSFYWNYFSYFYGSSFVFKPWSSTFDSINVNKHSKIIIPHFSQSIKKILSPFSSLNNLTGQNIFFKKWHSKKKEGFFYKRITKLELKKADFNSAKYSRVVSLLWGFRSKYKLDEVLQYQKSKYYQSKKAQQSAHQNIDQNSTDSKINKQIVIKTLNKRRRYKKYLELDILSSWLRDILYFRKMSRKLVPIKKDTYLFNINNVDEKKPLIRGGSFPRFKISSDSDILDLIDSEKTVNNRDRSALLNLSRFSAAKRGANLLLFKMFREKTSFFNTLRGKELKKISVEVSEKTIENNREKASRKNKHRQDRMKHFAETGFQSYHLSKKVFLSLKKCIRIKNFYQTRFVNKKLQKRKACAKAHDFGERKTVNSKAVYYLPFATPFDGAFLPRFRSLSDFRQNSYSFENFNYNSKFLNKLDFNNYNYFSNSLLFNSTPTCLKKISLNFSNKRLLKLNRNKKLEKSSKRDWPRTVLQGPFQSFFSLFKNLNRFFIYFKTIVTKQFFFKIKTFFYSGKNSFFVKNKREKKDYVPVQASSTKITTSSHIFEKQTKLTNRIRINNRWIKQNKWDLKMKNVIPSFVWNTGDMESSSNFKVREQRGVTSFIPRAGNNFKKFSSDKRSNLIKTNIKRSFLKKVSTFSTTVTKPSSGTFSFLSEKKISGNLDFILYRKNKRIKNEKWFSASNKKLLPFSFYGFKYPSFEELMVKFKNLSSSFVIWRNKFQIRRDYLLLSYIYLDYLGAIVNSVNCSSVVFNNNISSNHSFVNFLSGNLEWQTRSEKTINRIKEKSHTKNSLSTPSIEIFKNEQNYLLYAQHYKTNCLKPVWSFSIVNHLKINHLAVYEQLINFSHKLPRVGKGEKEKAKLFLSKTGISNIEKGDILKEEAKASFFPNSSLSGGFSTSLVLHRSIKSSKDFGKSFFFNASREAGLLPFHDSSTYNKKYLQYKNIIFNKKLGLLKNQQKYLFSVSFFKNKFKYRRKSGIYNRRIFNKQSKIYNGIFLSNLQSRLKDNELIMSNLSNNFNPIKINVSQIKVLTFWLCTLLFHVCLISSLLTSYKSSIHFCMKTLYSSLFVLNKYFVYTKYRIKRLINYVYQNNFEYLIGSVNRYFSMIKSSRVEIFNSLKFPDSFLQLPHNRKANSFAFSSAAINKNMPLTKFGVYGLNQISLKKVNFSQLFFLSYYFALKKTGKNENFLTFFSANSPFKTILKKQMLNSISSDKNLADGINPEQSSPSDSKGEKEKAKLRGKGAKSFTQMTGKQPAVRRYATTSGNNKLIPFSTRLLAPKTKDFYRFSFISKILGLFQYVQYKYQTPFTNLTFNKNNLSILNQSKKIKKTSSKVPKTENSKQLYYFPLSGPQLKNFQRDSKILTLLSPFSFSLLNSNSLNLKLQNLFGQKKLNLETESKSVLTPFFRSQDLRGGDFTQNNVEQNQINSLKTNLTKKLAKEKNFKVYFKVLQWNMLITLLIGESEVLAELEPYREMHWYFLKKFPIFLRTSSGKDYLSMSDYQADEKIRIIKQKIRQTIMILYLRSRKYESKLQNRPNQSQKKTSYLLKTRSNKKGQNEKSSSLKSQNQNNGVIQESNFSSLEKLVKTVFNFLYSFSVAKHSQERKRQKIKKLSPWKSILTFLGKYSFVTRSAILNKRFRESLMLFSQPLICFGPIATVFIPYGIKNFLLRFDQIDYQKKKANNQPFFSAFYLQNYKNTDRSRVNKETCIEFPVYLKQNKETEEERENKRYTINEINKRKAPDFFPKADFSVPISSNSQPSLFSYSNSAGSKQVYYSPLIRGEKLEESQNNSFRTLSIFDLEKLNFYIISKINKKLNFFKSELFTSIPKLAYDGDFNSVPPLNGKGEESKKLRFFLSNSFARMTGNQTASSVLSTKDLIFKSRPKIKEKHRKNLFIELDTSPLFELEFLTNLQKLIKKYNRVYHGFNSMKNKKNFDKTGLGNQSRLLAIKNSDFFLRNISTKNVKTIMAENNLYDWTYNESSNRLGKHSMYFDTFDPKLRYYRFSTNFSKVLSDVGGLHTNFAVHQELGPLICKVYTGLFSKQFAKNYLLVSGPTNNESVLFLVQALAAEIGMKVFMEDAKRLQRIGRRGINKATKRLEKLFDIAQANVPALVFIEDIHVIGSKTKMVKVDEEQDDVEILSRSLLSKLVYRKYHKNKSLREAFIDQNLLTGGSAVLRRRSLKPTNPIPKSLVLYQLTRRRAYSNFFKSQDNPSRKINTKLFLTKKLSPAFTTNAVLIWKLFKSKIATPNKRIKEAPWFHIPVDAMRSIHPLTYSIRVKVAKITLLAIFTMGTRLRLVKDLIRLFEKIHYNSHQNFIVFATTNKLSTLDPSLRRPGRLEEIISLYSLTGVSSSSRSPAFMSVLDTFKVYLKNVPGFSKTFSLIDNTLFSSNLNLKEWSLINYLAEASYYSVYSSKNGKGEKEKAKLRGKEANSLASPSGNSFESNSLNTVSFYQNLVQSNILSTKALKYFILSSLNFQSGANESFEHLSQDFSSRVATLSAPDFFLSEKNGSQSVQNKTDLVLKTVTNTQLKKQRMASFETKSKVNAAFSAGNLFTTQNSNSSNNSDYWQLIFSNITVQRKKGGFDFNRVVTLDGKACKKINGDRETVNRKNIYFNNRYKKYNKSNLFLTLAYSRSGQSLISFLLNYKNSFEQTELKSQLSNGIGTEGVCFDKMGKSQSKALPFFLKTQPSQTNRFSLFLDSDYLTNLQLWPETVNINSLKPQNTFYNRRKNLQSYFLRFFSSKVGELLFTNSIIWNLGWEREVSGLRLSSSSLTTKTGNDSKNYILEQEPKSGAEAFTFLPFLNNIYGITPDWTCAYSYIKNVVTTSSLYSKTPLISKLLRLEDVSKPRQKQFFESLNAGMLFEYSDFHYRAFFKKNNLSTEENLNLLIFQKYMLNNQGRPLRKYVKLESSNRLWLFRILYTELGTLDNISLRPTSMNYYYRNKIILKHLFKLSSYQWWNWHLRKPLEQLEDVQEIAYFPCENKYYNPRHRRWILTNGFWGYWFSFDKNFYFDLYEQYMFQSFHSAYLHLDQNREILDYLSKLYICREKLSETDLILSFKRYKI